MDRLVSIVLIFVLLASHINLTIGTHFCGGEAVMSKLMIGHEPLSCGMASMDEPCDESGNQDLSFANPPCCQNHYQTFKATDDFIKATEKINQYSDLLVALVYTIVNTDIISQSSKHFYADFTLPPLEKNIQVLFQTFII